jgi:hypothetical protein
MLLRRLREFLSTASYVSSTMRGRMLSEEDRARIAGARHGECDRCGACCKILLLHLDPQLGSKRLDRVTEEDIQMLKASLSRRTAKTSSTNTSDWPKLQLSSI